MKFAKIFLTNLIVLVSGLIVVEIFFGSWFKSNNFGLAIRELRNVSIPISVKLDKKKYNYIFKRNNLGFIGEEIDSIDIKILFLGGSTGEEMFKPPKYRIVDQINSFLIMDKIDMKIKVPLFMLIQERSVRNFLQNYKN